jgi:hypothetical protein
MAKTDKAPRMTRAQITEALETVPLDTILAGASTGGRLTPKQREFARNLALGKSKAQSYREAISDKGTKKTQAANGYKTARRADVQQIKEAYEVAIEAAKQRTPAQLREFVIHQLTQHAISEDVNPAQRIQALKLLGQVTEVAAFTERRETTTIRKSEDVRAALLEKLRTISGAAVEGEFTQTNDSAESLMAEISAGHEANAEENGQPDAQDDPAASDPTQPPPPASQDDPPSYTTHNVPHSRTPLESVPHSESSPESNEPWESPVDDEVIGLDVVVSPHIEVIAPIVAEKDPADDPTPLDMETPPVNGT